jgi:hypothetical protein
MMASTDENKVSYEGAVRTSSDSLRGANAEESAVLEEVLSFIMPTLLQ